MTRRAKAAASAIDAAHAELLASMEAGTLDDVERAASAVHVFVDGAMALTSPPPAQKSTPRPNAIARLVAFAQDRRSS